MQKSTKHQKKGWKRSYAKNKLFHLPCHLEMWFSAFHSYWYPGLGRGTSDYWENKINRTHNLPFHLEMWFVSFLLISWTGQSNIGLRRKYQQNTFTLSFGNVICFILIDILDSEEQHVITEEVTTSTEHPVLTENWLKITTDIYFHWNHTFLYCDIYLYICECTTFYTHLSSLVRDNEILFNLILWRKKKTHRHSVNTQK